MRITVPLNKLILSTKNVRKTPVPDLDIESMADSIASKGQLVNIIVSESIGGKGIYEVDDGGCRLRAFELLVKRKTIARNHPVECEIVARDDAREASLAGNTVRFAMNLADEVVGYAEVVADYEGRGIIGHDVQVANLARRFGQPVRYIEQRLRLAALAPEILAAMREGRVSVEAAKAYATYSDRKLQLKTFAAEEKKPEQYRHQAKAIKDAIAGKVYPIDHPAVIYIGLDAYRAAGGRIDCDLFMGLEDKEVLLDPSIIDRLCAKRTEEDARLFAQEDGWKDGVVKSWSGPSWQDAKAPAGMKRTWGREGAQLSAEQRAESVRAFKIADDGSTLEPLEYVFVPLPEPAKPSGSTYKPETPEQIAARERQREIERKALQLAAPSFVGTPFDGRVFWPKRHAAFLDPIVQDEDGSYVVAVFVRIPAADVVAASAEAERLYEAELAELAEEEAAIEAAASADAEAPAAADAEPVVEPAQ